MYTLKCSELDPGGNCDFSTTGETRDEVIKNLQDHAASDHAKKMASMTPEEQTAMMAKMNELLDAQEM